MSVSGKNLQRTDLSAFISLSGAIYDYRKSYDDVFYVVGALYVIDAVIFASIPFVDKYRKRSGKLNYADIPGGVGQQNETQTFRITKSVSKSSLVNGDADGNVAVDGYGTGSSADRARSVPPQRPPQPQLRRPTEDSPLNPFRESYGRETSQPYRESTPMYSMDMTAVYNREGNQTYNRFQE